MNVKLSFWVRPSQKNNQQKVPIYLCIIFNKVRTQSSIGEYVNLSQWDKKGQRVKGLSAESEAINGKLDSLKSRAIKVYNELLLNGEPFNAFTIKDKLLNVVSQAITFDDIMNEYLIKMKSLIGKSYAKPTIIKYKNSQVRVSEYVLKRYKRNHIYLYELNYEFIEGFETFLKKNYDNSNTTIAKHYQRISRVVRIALNKGYINRFPFGEYKPIIDKTPLIYLTYEEVKKIEAKTFSIYRMEMIKKTFLLSCYSGLSFKEMENLKPENIITSDDKVYWISMVRQKTKKPYKIVLLPQAYQLIQDLQFYDKNIRKGKLLPIISNQKYNSYLKELADQCGIPKNLTSHVGRKTFSIGIALRSSVSIELLSALLGHSSIRVTTDYYTKITDEVMIEGVQNLSDQLKRYKSPEPQ
ncbi:MAG: site-specific integrase [Bacteroidales bacterium]